ncbi:hypothetical protein K0H43_01145 [Bacteroides fragilis]|nr:hypothetical protein [Bacteroides fragilis]
MIPAEVTMLANTSFAATSGKGGTISGVPSSAQYLYFMANIKTDVGQVFPAIEGTTSADARLRLNRLQGTAPSDWTANAFVDYCTPLASALSFYPDVTISTPRYPRMSE